MPTKLIGNQPHQVPRNADLGSLAYQSSDNATVSNLYVDTKLSGFIDAQVGISGNQRPSIQPTLSFDFANSEKLDPRISFSRASTATYYDGKTIAKAEENLLLYSEDFTQWSVYGTNGAAPAISPNNFISNDGSITADRLTQQANGSSNAFQQLGTYFYKTGQTYTASVYVKNVNATHFFIGPNTWDGTGYCVVEFALSSTPTVSRTALPSSWTLNSTSVTAEANGFYRVSITFTVGAVNATYSHRLAIGFGDGTGSIASDAQIICTTGAGTSFYLWGAQIEQRSQVSAYTKTTTDQKITYIPVLQTAPADSPRFDFDPVTKTCRGLLFEEARTNHALYSDSLTDTWTGLTGQLDLIFASSVNNIIVSPAGTLSGGLLYNTAEGGRATTVLSSSVGTTKNNPVTFSAYLKATPSTSIVNMDLVCQTATTNFVYRTSAVFDLKNGKILSQTNDAIDSSTPAGISTITPVGNGWYRCSISFATYNGANTLNITLAEIRPNYLSADGSVYVWGRQFEVGYNASSYIPTSFKTVTREPDLAFITDMSWLNINEGTFVTKFDSMGSVSRNGQSAAVFCATTNIEASAPVYALIYSDSQTVFPSVWDDGGTNQLSGVYSNNGTCPFGTVVNTGYAYTYNDVQLALSGSLVGINDTSVLLPRNLDKMFIGCMYSKYNRILNGHIAKLAYYPKRVANSELQALTAS